MNVKSLGYIGIESMKMDDIGWRISVKKGGKEDPTFAGFGARTVDDNWSVAHHNSPSTWGHKRAAR